MTRAPARARPATAPAAADQLLSTAQVAERLGCSINHVRRLHDAGELPTVVDLSLPGGRVRRSKLRFTEAAVAALIERRTHVRIPSGSTGSNPIR